MPIDSMSLQSAIMYLQNSLMAIESMKQNEVNYGIYIKFLLRQQALNAQHAALTESRSVASFISGYQATILNPPQNQSLSDSLNDSTDT